MKKLSQFAVIAVLVVGSIACTDRSEKVEETTTVDPAVVSTAPETTGTDTIMTETSTTTETTTAIDPAAPTATDATTSTTVTSTDGSTTSTQ